MTSFLIRLEVLDLNDGLGVVDEVVGGDITTITFEFCSWLKDKVYSVEMLVVQFGEL